VSGCYRHFVCCLLNCNQNSRSVPIAHHSNTDLTPTAILSELSKLVPQALTSPQLKSCNADLLRETLLGVQPCLYTDVQLRITLGSRKTPLQLDNKKTRQNISEKSQIKYEELVQTRSASVASRKTYYPQTMPSTHSGGLTLQRGGI
jgi:hypothetical protein